MDGEYLKVKLNDALRSKVDDIDERRQAEVAEKEKFEQMTKQQKQNHANKLRGKLEKKNKKTLFQEERDVHEAYQLLLSEHNTRVKQRMKQKISTVAALSRKAKVPSPARSNTEKPPSSVDPVDVKIDVWQRNKKPTNSSKSEG